MIQRDSQVRLSPAPPIVLRDSASQLDGDELLAQTKISTLGEIRFCGFQLGEN